MSNFKELIIQFGEAAGISGMQLDDDGLCRIVIDGNTTIDFELDSRQKALLLIGHIIPSVDEVAEDVTSVSLALNADVARNRGSFLAYDEAGDEILLLRRLDNEALHLGDFQTIVNEFAAHIDYCRTTLLTEGEDDDDEGNFTTEYTSARQGDAEMVMLKL